VQNYIFFYARVSHEDSASSGKGMEAQMVKCNAWFQYARASGRFPEHRLAGSGVRFHKRKSMPSITSSLLAMEDGNDPFFIDEATSALKKPFRVRPAGLILDQQLKKGDVVVFPYLDRAFRNFRDFAVTCQEWLERGVIVIFLDPSVDMSDIWGRAMAGIFAIFAQLDSDLKSKRGKEIAARFPNKRTFAMNKRIKTAQGLVHVPDLYKRWEILELMVGWRTMQLDSQSSRKVVTYRQIAEWLELIRAQHEGTPVRPLFDRGWQGKAIERQLAKDRMKNMHMLHGITDDCRPMVEAELHRFRLSALAAIGPGNLPPATMRALEGTGPLIPGEAPPAPGPASSGGQPATS
jgi:DNA invertase Pin-like site-specific DNA recombinase